MGPYAYASAEAGGAGGDGGGDYPASLGQVSHTSSRVRALLLLAAGIGIVTRAIAPCRSLPEALVCSFSYPKSIRISLYCIADASQLHDTRWTHCNLS